jgi:DNA repair protein RadC
MSNATYTLNDNDITTHSSSRYVLRVKDMSDDEKPREKLLQLGATNLSLAELVAIIWGVGHKGEDVLAMAHRTLKEYGEKAIANETNPTNLAAVAGIPLTKACQVIAALELGKRFNAPLGRPVRVHNARQAYAYLKDMGASRKEQLRGVYLNSRYQVIYDEVISVGSLTSNIIHPREVFQPAIERGAVALIIAHNHPSGSLEPSAADISVTEQLISAGRVLGIDLIDHLIITASGYVSLMEAVDV